MGREPRTFDAGELTPHGSRRSRLGDLRGRHRPPGVRRAARPARHMPNGGRSTRPACSGRTTTSSCGPRSVASPKECATCTAATHWRTTSGAGVVGRCSTLASQRRRSRITRICSRRFATSLSTRYAPAWSPRPADWPWSTYGQLVGTVEPWPFFDPAGPIKLVGGLSSLRDYVESERTITA